MTFDVFGNIIAITTAAEDKGQSFIFHLPDGYSFKKICMWCHRNTTDSTVALVMPGTNRSDTQISFKQRPEHYEFPIVDGKSPCFFEIATANDVADNAYCSIMIEEFGAKPDESYNLKPFEPVLIKDSSGREYNLIRANQFSQRG